MEKSKKRRCYDADVKKKIILFAEENGNRVAGRMFNIPESCIRLWRKHQAEIFAATDNPPTQKKTVSARPKRTGRLTKADRKKPAHISDIDELLFGYIEELRKNEIPISLTMLVLRLEDIAMSLDISLSEFEPTRKWIEDFISRKLLPGYHKISSFQKVSTEYEKKLLKYQHFIIQLRKQNKYPLSQIGHANEVRVFVDSMTHPESSIKVMLCVTADGGKLPPFLIFRSGSVLKKSFAEDVIVRTEENGCLTHELLLDWYKTVWCYRPGSEVDLRAVLTLDSSTSHLLTEDWLVQGNTDLVLVPNGTVSLPQPVNVYINRVFKEKLRVQCEKWLLSQGRLKSASPSLLSHWISSAWHAVPQETIIRSFKECYPSAVLEDGADDDATIVSEDEYIVFCDEDDVSDVHKMEEVTSRIPDTFSAFDEPGLSDEQSEVPIPLELVAGETEADDPLDIGSCQEEPAGPLEEELIEVKVEQQADHDQTETTKNPAYKESDASADNEQAPSTEDSEIVVVVYDDKLRFMHGSMKIPTISSK